MGGEGSIYRWWCVSCGLRHPRNVSHRAAVHAASDHAALNGGHTVFILRHGKSNLEVFWFPPHTLEPLPGIV